MSSAVGTLVERVSRPEYTGANRCLPCTVVNVAIALVVAAGVGLLATPVAGVVVLGCSFASIWLRGYLVPGTPELTKRYLPDAALRRFGKAPSPAADDAVDVEAYLVEVAALQVAGEGDEDLRLAPEFAAAWREELDAVRSDAASAAGDVLELDDPEVESRGDVAVVTDGGVTAAHWPSRPALVADLAAVRALRDRDPAWTDRDQVVRGRILAGLRLFLERCPNCGATPELSEGTVESCCRRAQVYTYACTDCGARLLEVER